MAKIINRAILVSGERKKVGTPVVQILELSVANLVRRSTGTAVPTNGDAGYSIGSLFNLTSGNAPGATVYINEGSTTSCTFNALSSAAAGVSTWNQLYANGATLAITGTTLTFDGQHATNDVFTLTSTGAGSGSLLQITNVGTGKDINGTSSSWSVDKTGVAVFKSETLSGTAASNILTITAGDILVSAGGLAITKAANNATLSVTNNTATSASVVVLAGSGVFTSGTTSSFMTLTPSGLTSGTAFYLITAGLTTGRSMFITGNSLTSGIMFNIASAATAITTTGRLFLSTHSGATGSSAILNEFITAANDETILLQCTASSSMALGVMLNISASSLTTGFGLSLPDHNALTSGIMINAVTSATAITGIGRMLFVNHTGSTTSGGAGILNEIKTAATDGTVLARLTATTTLTGKILQFTATTLATGTVIDASAINGLTTGIVLSLGSTSTGITTGSLIRATMATTGAIATNGVYSFLGTAAFTTTASTLGMFHVAGASTVTGTIMSILGGAQTTGIALNITDPSAGMTSGSLLRVITATTAAVATNGIVSIQASGAYTSTSNAGLLNVSASALVGTGTVANFSSTAASQTTANIVNVTQSGATLTGYTASIVSMVGGFSGAGSTGNIIGITAVNDLAGDALLITNNALTLGAATMINLVHGTSVLGAGTSMLRLTSTGVDTGTTTGTMLDLAATAATAAVLMLVTSATLSTGKALLMNLNGLTTGAGIHVAHTTAVIADGGSLLRLSSTSIDTGGATNGVMLDLSNTASVAGVMVKHVYSALTTGTGQIMTMAALTTTGIGLSLSAAGTGLTSGSVLLVSSGTTGAVATNGVVSLQMTGAFTSASSKLGAVSVQANSTVTGTAMSIGITSATTGFGLVVVATAATFTTGRYISCNDTTTGEVFGVGTNGHLISTVTASAASAAVTVQNGITAATIVANSTDTAGGFTTTGTNNNGGATTVTVSFGKTYTTAPKAVILQAANSAAVETSAHAAVATAYVSSITATTFVVTIPPNASAQATPAWNYIVIA